MFALQATQQPLSLVESFVWILVGIIFSLVLPIAVRTLKHASKLEVLNRKAPTWSQRLVAAWNQYGGNKYLGILAAMVVVALAIILLLGMVFYTVRDAAIAGFAWESLISKLFAQQKTEAQSTRP